jgi:hypothetical protein
MTRDAAISTLPSPPAPRLRGDQGNVAARATAYEAEITMTGAPFIWVKRRALDRLELVVRIALLGTEVGG